jgi:DNA ligase D-like protein (predicted ligase)
VLEAAIERPQPDWFDPMLATLTEDRFSDPDWFYERKLDGERCLAFKRGGSVTLRSRNRESLAHYPEIAEALAGQAADGFVLDGEIVAYRGRRSSFELLQRRMGIRDPAKAVATGVRVRYVVFDVLYAAGHDLTPVPLRDRKAVLRSLFAFDGALRFSTHRVRDGVGYYEEACRRGWEGVIAKRAGSPYVGRRSPDWLKFKCVWEQEFVIAGWTDPKGSRAGLGALLLGYHEGGELRFGGKVGTGFDDRMLDRLSGLLRPLETSESPFADHRRAAKGEHFAQPRLVGQVAFSEWTRDGQLRHPRFLGLRDDKSPEEVVRERPA